VQPHKLVAIGAGVELTIVGATLCADVVASVSVPSEVRNIRNSRHTIGLPMVFDPVIRNTIRNNARCIRHMLRCCACGAFPGSGEGG